MHTKMFMHQHVHHVNSGMCKQSRSLTQWHLSVTPKAITGYLQKVNTQSIGATYLVTVYIPTASTHYVCTCMHQLSLHIMGLPTVPIHYVLIP